MKWYPHVTVAAIVESAGKFLLVEEKVAEGCVFNQPAGHLEKNETLIEAVIRETEEESGWIVEPTYFLGVRLYTSPANKITYVRHSFICAAKYQKPDAVLDQDIIKTVWMTYEEAQEHRLHLRSPLVLFDMETYLNGAKYPLDLINYTLW